MSGLKSGSGDDLWGDEDEEGEADERPDGEADREPPRDATTAGSRSESTSRPEGGARSEGSSPSEAPSQSGGSTGGRSSGDGQPYIVRRAIRDKSVQFERDERLTFFVHGDVADGERELVNEVESTLGRSVPKFDVREAVYRAALRNPEDVLDELLAMGYTVDED